MAYNLRNDDGSPITTAQYREKARAFEKACEWQAASTMWALAIEAYPTTGALADLDKSKMRARFVACTNTALDEDMRRLRKSA